MKQYAATQIEPGSWEFVWTPTAGRVYEIWLDGLLQATTAAGAGTYTSPPGGPTDAPPPIEIHDTADGKAQNEEYPPRTLLQWRGVPEASGYHVEQLKGSWIPVASDTERGLGWYMYNTGILIDGALNQFRVTALDQRGVAGAEVSFDMVVVCNPRPPKVTVGISAGTVTVERS